MRSQKCREDFILDSNAGGLLMRRGSTVRGAEIPLR